MLQSLIGYVVLLEDTKTIKTPQILFLIWDNIKNSCYQVSNATWFKNCLGDIKLRDFLILLFRFS